MRKVAKPTQDLDRFTYETDPSSTPVDIDRLVARFLIRLVRNKQSRTPLGSPAAGSSFSNSPEHRKEQTL